MNAPEGFGPDGQPLIGAVPPTKSAKNGGLSIRPHKLTAAASAAMAASAQQAAAAIHHPDLLSPMDHQQSAADLVGQGTPMGSRPKKRLPSGKGRKATGSGNNSSSDMPGQSSDVPPVPSIPDMHRQPSPHSMGMTLQSPMSVSASYPGYTPHHPGEYHPSMHQSHHHHQSQHHLGGGGGGGGGPSPTQQSFTYPPGEYSYYPPPQQGQQQQQQQGGGNGYLGIGSQGSLASPYGHTGHPGQGHSPGGGPSRDADRRLMGMGI